MRPLGVRTRLITVFRIDGAHSFSLYFSSVQILKAVYEWVKLLAGN